MIDISFQCDQPKEGVVNQPSQMDKFCEEKGFISWFETSAKENVNIDDAAKYLVQKVYSLLNSSESLLKV